MSRTNYDAKLSELARAWLLNRAREQRDAAVEDLIENAKRLKRMRPARYLREVGLADLCPTTTPEELRDYLRIGTRTDQHFHVRGDPGNVGSRLEVKSGNVEWDNVADPWHSDADEDDGRPCPDDWHLKKASFAMETKPYYHALPCPRCGEKPMAGLEDPK